MTKTDFENADDVARRLEEVGYLASGEIATAAFLATRMGKPILAEGPAGAGKTSLAKALADALGLELVRLQCYEGLDETKTLYEWKYAKQLLYSQVLRDQVKELLAGAKDLSEAIERVAAHEDAFFSRRFLEPRALLKAVLSEERVVLLIDEVDRAEDELEAFFLEILGEFQVTVPELGTLHAAHPPLVVLTSNATRELSDALRRRCIYLHIDFPDPEMERRIVSAHLPELDRELAARATEFVSRVRGLDLKKAPSIAETLDWARSLVVLGATSLDAETVRATLSVLFKFAGDATSVNAKLSELLSRE